MLQNLYSMSFDAVKVLGPTAEQLQESDEIRALAEDYLRAVASQNRLTLLRWCLAQEGMDVQTLSAFLPAVQHRLVHLLAEPDETVRAAASPAGDLRALPPRQCRHEAYLWPAVRFGRAGESSEVRISN